MPQLEAAARPRSAGRTVRAPLNYIARIDEPLYVYYYMDPPPGKLPTNEAREPHEVTIASLRELVPAATLDREGFELIPFTTSIADIYDLDELKRVFYPEAEAAVMRATGARRAIATDPFLRGPEAQRRAPGSITAPAPTVHVDYTVESGPVFFEQILGSEAEQWRGCHFAMINLWRPITGPLRDHPLAVCDASSVPPEDLMLLYGYSQKAADGLFGEAGEVQSSYLYSGAYNPAHRWYYVPDMMPDEALLLKNYDSRTNVARFSPHTAFADPTAPADILPRASIEVRVLAIF